MLSAVSLLERSMEVSIVGFLGLRLNLGILSMALGRCKGWREVPKEKQKLRRKLGHVAVFTRGLASGGCPSIRSRSDGDLGTRRGIVSLGLPGWWRPDRARVGSAWAMGRKYSAVSTGVMRRRKK
jgi:hypothetical protein